MVEEKNFKVDSFVLMASLRYAMERETYALSLVKDNVEKNLHDLPNEVLEQMAEELTDHYTNRTEDGNYVVANEMVVMIKHELYDE